MFVLLNLVILGCVALISWWWANQGLFSALLHLVCVLAAGAIALGLWEPIVYAALKGGPADNFIIGPILVGLFLVSLLILRIIMDKVVGANVKLPTWANLVFGIPVAAVAGIVTMGLFVIGGSFTQSTKEPFGYGPYGRDSRTGQVMRTGRILWLPVDKITSDLYSLLSRTSLYPEVVGMPMAEVQPDLWIQASLVRDSVDRGRGMISLQPSAARVTNIYFCPEDGVYAVQMQFEAKARDFATQLTLSRSQLRLIGADAQSSEPMYVFPDSWTQPTGYFRWDDVSHYATSESGQQSTEMTFFFPAGAMSQNAHFVQVRNTRYRIERIQQVPPSTIRNLRGPGAIVADVAAAVSTAQSGGDISSLVRLSNNPRPIRASRNMGLGTLQLDSSGKFFVRGEHKFPAQGDRPNRQLAIDGLFEPPGTRVIQVDVARGAATDLYSGVAERAGENPELMLVDDQGRTYWPMGFLHVAADGYRLRLDPENFVKTLADLPILPSSGTQEMRLLFIVTQNVRITSLRFGSVTLGTCNLLVEPPR